MEVILKKLVYNFLKKIKIYLILIWLNFHFLNQKKVDKFIHVKYQEKFHGIIVNNAFIKMSYLNNGRLVYVSSTYVYDT